MTVALSHGEVMMRSAEFRLKRLWDEVQRDSPAEDHHIQALEVGLRDQGPSTEVRRKLKPLWGWNKLMRGR